VRRFPFSVEAHCVLALRSNDKAGVDDVLKTCVPSIPRPPSSVEKPSRQPSGSFSAELSTPLHLAVQCAPTSMVEYVISTGKIDLSARNRVGNTALHLAALQGRDDVVDVLLQQPDIDDSVVNHEGKQVPSPRIRKSY
jgi:oxysterol-binding protein 1